MEWVFSFVIIFASAMIQTSTGFGFTILSIPLLLMIHNAHYAITMCILLSLMSALTTFPRIHKDIDRKLLKSLFLGSLLGMPLGGLLFHIANVLWLKMIVSIAIIIFTLLLIFRISLPLGTGKRIGFLSGFMTASIGMPGPPIVLYLASKNTDKGAFRGTSIAYYCLVYPISLLIQFISNHVQADLFLFSLLMIPAIFIGQAVGSVIHRKISHKWFLRLTYSLLLATALNSLIQSL